ncbi:MAG: hypothetical protein G8345_03165 [Magnetococcales bacterium]|nr:hypothetical protein [Magnetococcales bacterium]NGZ25873.1 hypothetical protein [Magnetococcales bacterium]
MEIASPMLFFFIGYFPQRAMDVMENRANAILSTDANRKNPRPDEDLSRLQGMDISVINRLEDLGIQKAQSLAFVDLYFLEQNFNTNPRRLADLVSQALLLIYTGEHFEQLVTMGIRDMVTLQEISKFPILAEAISDLPKPVQDKINIVQSLLQSSKLRDRLQSLNEFIAMAEEREKEELVEGMTRQLPKVGGEAETAKDSGGSPAC